MSDLRPISESEVPAYLTQIVRIFEGRFPTTEEIETRRSTIELDRTLAAFEDGKLVATAGIITMRLTVPGRQPVPAAGVSRITVLPTHRRRGLLTDIVRRQLDDARSRGEPVAILHATEGGIYGRFGYGVATYSAALSIERHRSSFLGPVDVRGVEYVEPDRALELAPAISARFAPGQPGMIERDKDWWRQVVSDQNSPRRPGLSASYLLVHHGSGPDGFAMYHKHVEFDQGGPTGSLRLRYLLAENPTAYAALWRHCLDVDLTTRVHAPVGRVDEPLRHLLLDPRAMQSSVVDQLWLRLVDVASALSARAYRVDGDLRLLVKDAFCERNSGVYRLSGGPEGARCERDAGEPDLAVSVAGLGACYLGGNSFTDLLRAGALEELRPGAAELADAMFGSPIAPWCAYHF